MQIWKFVTGAALALAMTGTARGESISFSFTDVFAGIGSSFTYTKGGLTLKVTGTNKVGTGPTTSSLVSRTLLGLGVVGGPVGNPLGMDNLGSVESLIFDFSPHEVVINKMSFKFIDTDDNNDEVLLTVWGTGASTEYDISTQGVGNVNFDFTTATPYRDVRARTGMKFVASTTDWNDNYTIAGLVVDYMKYVPPPVVLPPSGGGVVAPLPSSVWGGGLLLGLSGWVVWARKRRNNGDMASA